MNMLEVVINIKKINLFGKTFLPKGGKNDIFNRITYNYSCYSNQIN